MEERDLRSAYQAPKTRHLDDGGEPYQPQMFAFRGRIGRARYVAYTWWVTFVVLFLGGMLMALLGGVSSALLGGLDQPGAVEAVAVPWMFAVGLLTYVPMLVMAKRRLNDLNLTGWFALLVFAPVINVLFMLYLLLWPGDEGANRFGAPPAGNGVLVIIFGVGLPLLMLLRLSWGGEALEDDLSELSGDHRGVRGGAG